ncbi:FAD-dependent oxidoreductase [Chelatococcus sp. HY11]|uniref:NAD(P)/FAD-dependent oxidoreductase n=2 Tax=unclassified Chelatococcus TaxID=2638111 RepID=UPI001BCCFD32|nr:FAD-dependent oxidoreductase [Chelatococcus sp. HY11]MBS7739115.1 FAD-dependent oxidoreductase [Chelatococcus sp. HY11]
MMQDRGGAGREVTVIGAGIIGVCCALWLQRAGFDVTIVDKNEPGNGTSFGNTAMITPSQVVPQSMPGLWKDLPRWLMSSRSPLKIRPGYLPMIAPWLWEFHRAATVENAIRVHRSLRALHGGTFNLYAELSRSTPAENFFEMCGHMHLTVQGAKSRSSELAGLMREAAGVVIEPLSQDDIRALEPRLAPIFKSGVLMPGSGRCRNPHRLVQIFAQEAVRNGARFIKADVNGISVENGRCVSIDIDGTRTPVQRIVVAAGMGSRALTGKLGIKVPLDTERGYHVTVPDPGFRPERQVIVREWGIGVGPIDDALRGAGTVEFCSVNAKPNWKRANNLLKRMKEIYPSVNTEGATLWKGDRPSISDGLPVLGRPARYQNVYCAFGNAQHGMTAGPMMGKLVAEIVSGQATSIDVAPLSPDRF